MSSWVFEIDRKITEDGGFIDDRIKVDYTNSLFIVRSIKTRFQSKFRREYICLTNTQKSRILLILFSLRKNALMCSLEKLFYWLN